MIASVIVDVPTKQTDRSFDYKIPPSLENVIQPGIRVIVPFGPRKVLGFVTAVKEHSDVKGLRNIIAPMDLSPVLSPEMLKLADWLAENTLCYKISALHVMLPPALKARYEKKIRLAEDAEPDNMPAEVRKLFADKDTVVWKDGLSPSLLSLLHKEAAKGNVEVIYEVKDRAKKKKVKYIFPALSQEELAEERERLSTRAYKQRDVVNFFIENREPLPYNELLAKTGGSSAAVGELIKKGILKEKYVEVYRDPYDNRNFSRTKALPLTEEQKRAIAPVLSAIEGHRHEIFLLYGVTGSGKTEIYLQAIERVIEKGKEAIVLVPEISLTPQMVKRFKERFGDLVAVLHSGLSTGEKYDEWRKIQRKEVKVVVGARSAVFAPFENLGIIIIDEEHETSYKQEDTPRYHARDVAVERGKHHRCPVVLGSATPSLESFARAKKGVYTLLELPTRVNNRPLPAVEIIDMREELRAGNRSVFSRALLEAMKERLEKGEQIVLFLNRRGYSSFVMCRDCGYVVGCPHCDISLTYHRFDAKMKCHYCGFESPVPASCPECGSKHIRYFGTGTQKIEEELGKILPEARVIRMDVDTTSRKGSHERILGDFQAGKADILLGTQMIAKGLDFPNITLVGVLSADTMLHLPDFRSAEKTFQLLTQVSGRAGRHSLKGEVIIQTYTPEHYSIQLAAQHDYESFFHKEMLIRRRHAYPPYYFITLITVSHENLMKAIDAADRITKFVKSRVSAQAIVLGPSASAIPRINDRYRYQCLIKYKREPELGKILKTVFDHFQQDSKYKDLQISIDINPYILM